MDREIRCTDASARAFGVETVDAHDALIVIAAIREQIGRGYQPINFQGTIGRFIKENLTGDFLIITAGHCMALRSGNLTDTEQGGNRRRVLAVLEITG